MDPLTNLELWFTKWGAYVVAVVLIALGIVGWLGYNSWRNSRNQTAIITAGHAIDNANAGAGQNASNVVSGNQQKGNDTDAKTQPIIQNFNTYPAAKTAIDPALFDAFNAGVCMYRPAANLLQCREVQQLHSK